MAGDNQPTVWPADEHTLAKLKILEEYLKAWMPILSRHAKSRPGSRIVYIDAFAGPGVYEMGEQGSPLVVLETARRQINLPVPIDIYFIEKDRRRWEHLKQTLTSYRSIHSSSRNIVLHDPILGEAAESVPEILGPPGAQDRPSLVFLDQFGYSAVPMDLVQYILSSRSSEIFSFMNWRELNRWLSDKTKWPGIDQAFGNKAWREIIDLSGKDRQSRFLEEYTKSLRETAGASYSWTFAMHGQDNQLLYWLIFCSNSDRGLEEMKKAMWKVGSEGSFKFSDKYSGQLELLPGFNQEWLADRLFQSLQGRAYTVEEVRHFVLTETPCYRYYEALTLLEKAERLTALGAPRDRRRGSFGTYLGDSTFQIRLGEQQLRLM